MSLSFNGLVPRTALALGTLAAIASAATAAEPILNPDKLLTAQTFWDNRDWDWYKANIPFFECPDPDITTTYYYRWELVTKHLTYGSPNTGYVFTEFIDRPFWSGTYGAISCPAGLQLYEVRWLRDPRYARDYCRYWFRTPGAQPRRYSTWLADAVWAVHLVHPDDRFTTDLLPDLVKNYEGWEKEHFDRDVGLFWQTGHDDGMEYNINSRQTKDIVRGAPGYRPTLNSYMAADAGAIAAIAQLADRKQVLETFVGKQVDLSKNFQKLWDEKRQFYFPMARRDETADGFTVKAHSLTYQTGRFAGNTHGRELIGYAPWQFNVYAEDISRLAWKPFMGKDGFEAPFGPTTVERHDPLFKISPTCCWWSGNSWPYATSQTLTAMANMLQGQRNQARAVVTNADYLKLLTAFAKTHRKNGKPYIAEACNPDTGSWEGHDNPGHSDHYFHSSFCDLVITGLVGMTPYIGPHFVLRPLAPPEWDYFALDNLPYHGYRLTILWDKHGTRYGRGKGFRVFADGKELASRDELNWLHATLPSVVQEPVHKQPLNYAVNNDATYFPRVSASYTGPRSNAANLIDGNYWYHVEPPNRWTCAGSPNSADWVAIDFGTPQPVDTVKLYFLDDGTGVGPPAKFDLDYWTGTDWKPVPQQKRPESIIGHRPTTISFSELKTTKLRATFTHAAGGKSGLTEFEAWGPGDLPLAPAQMPTGLLSVNPTGKGYPKASASFTSRFDKVEEANDGKTSFNPTPHNRWTSYESPNATDWLEIDFGAAKTFARMELGIYDDHGGVQPPEKYEVEYWDGKAWRAVEAAKKLPERPTGGVFNEVRFKPVTAAKVRVVFAHRGKARSGVTEFFVWAE